MKALAIVAYVAACVLIASMAMVVHISATEDRKAAVCANALTTFTVELQRFDSLLVPGSRMEPILTQQSKMLRAEVAALKVCR